jgi:hypothetical protein
MNIKDEVMKEFVLEDFKLNPLSSTELIRKTTIIDENDSDVLSLSNAPTASDEADAIEETDETLDAGDSIFKELAEPKLPELSRENRARLQMQSPNKIYFYWSIKNNPFQTLNRVFGNQTNYQLIAKLVNQTNEREEVFPIEAEGTTWFDVDANSTYRVEIGFYAVNRPFVRVMFSNAVETPRKNPSPRRDYSLNFAVSANQFAEVLDVSGFQQDAFEVALAGDDIEFADHASQTAFAQITDTPPTDFDANQASEIRFVLLALASGYQAENLRGYLSPSLFAVLQGSSEKLSAEKALAALQTNFGVSAGETFEEESFAGTVFGASLINFPRFSKRKSLPKFSPISSLPAKYF